MIKLIGLDPGKVTGYASVVVEDSKIHLIDFGTTKDTTLLEIRTLIQDADIVVYEDFLVRPNQAKRGSFDWDPMITPRVIGALTVISGTLEKTQNLVRQQPAVKPVGYAFAGLKYVPGKKGTHWEDALAHVSYYCAKHLAAHFERKTS